MYLNSQSCKCFMPIQLVFFYNCFINKLSKENIPFIIEISLDGWRCANSLHGSQYIMFASLSYLR